MLPDTFRTTRLLLRPVAVEDTDAIFDTYVQDEEVARYVIWRPHRNRRETQSYIRRCVATPHAVERTYMLVGCDDNVIRGAFALRQRAPHRLDCGYVLARRWWGQGWIPKLCPRSRSGPYASLRSFALVQCVTWITSDQPEYWKNRGSLEREYCSAGWSIQISARSRATAIVTPAYVDEIRPQLPQVNDKYSIACFLPQSGLVQSGLSRGRKNSAQERRNPLRS